MNKKCVACREKCIMITDGHVMTRGMLGRKKGTDDGKGEEVYNARGENFFD